MIATRLPLAACAVASLPTWDQLSQTALAEVMAPDSLLDVLDDDNVINRSAKQAQDWFLARFDAVLQHFDLPGGIPE